MHFQRDTTIVGARRLRLIELLVIGPITLLVALQGSVVHASAHSTRTGACATVSTKLSKASEGLLMPSESDFPFTSFTWTGEARQPLTIPRLLELSGHAPGTVVEVVGLGSFFRNVASPQPWHDRQQAMDVRRFQRLVRVFEQHLTDIHVYRVGTIRIDAYIVGRCGRDLTGLSTTLIET